VAAGLLLVSPPGPFLALEQPALHCVMCVVHYAAYYFVPTNPMYCYVQEQRALQYPTNALTLNSKNKPELLRPDYSACYSAPGQVTLLPVVTQGNRLLLRNFWSCAMVTPFCYRVTPRELQKGNSDSRCSTRGNQHHPVSHSSSNAGARSGTGVLHMTFLGT
jgi:hypothetical protein